MKNLSNFGDIWPQEDVDLLWLDIPDEEIAQRTGRTVSAVRSKRYIVTGYYSYKAMIAGRPKLSAREKHLYELAESLNVKIGG